LLIAAFQLANVSNKQNLNTFLSWCHQFT